MQSKYESADFRACSFQSNIAGTYRNTDGSAGCHWERLSVLSDEPSVIIANEFKSDPTIVTIEGTDAGFHSDDSGNWVQS